MEVMFGRGGEAICYCRAKNRLGGREGEKLFLFPYAVDEGAESNLWFDIGSPWLSLIWREGLSVSPWVHPLLF